MSQSERLRGISLALLAAAIAAVSAGGAAFGLTDEEIFRGYPFSTWPQGARSMGMGGAFVAIADDLSAPDANPAGLRAIEAPLVQLEYGSFDEKTARFRSRQGSLDVNPVTGDRSLPFLALASSRAPEETGEPGLVGFAWPFRLGDRGHRLVVALTRRVAAREEVSLPSSGARTQARFAFDSFPNTVTGSTVEAYSITSPVTGTLDSEILAYDLVVSADVHEDFSVGATLTQARIDLTSRTLVRVEDPQQILASVSHPRLPAQQTADIYTTEADGSDTDLAWSLGVNWHPRTSFAGSESPWRFGASYHRGAAFGIEERTSLNAVPDRRLENRFVIPDRYQIGAAYRHHERLTVSAEIERIELSDLMDGFRPGINYLTSDHLASGAFATNPRRPSRFKINDGNVYRLGVEYAWPLPIGGGGTIAARAGWFLTPDMRLQMTAFNSGDAAVNRTYRKAFPEGDAEGHLTVGAGLTWRGLQVQGAFESSDLGDRWLASVGWAFGRK